MFEVSFYLLTVGMIFLGMYGIYEVITGGIENEKVEHEAEDEKRKGNIDMYV